MYKKTLLNNGIRIVTNTIKDRDSIALGFWVGVGGRYEEQRIKGAAHFLEHIVFKGSKKYTGEEIKMRIEGVGGAMNAFTSEEQTCFYAKIPAKHLNQTFDVLSDMVIAPNITAADVNKEKTVIVEEIKMYHDMPQYFVLELLDRLMWPDHPLGQSLPGSVETVTGMSNKDLKAFHKMHYAPGNIVVAACGNLSHEKILALVKKKMGLLKDSSKSEYIKADQPQTKPRIRFFKRDIEQMHLAIGLPAYDEWHKDRYVLNLLSVILGGNMSSRLFVEVREKKGLAYSISSTYKSLHDTGLFLIRAGVDNQKVVEAIKVIFKELEKIKRNGVDANEFKRGREYLLGQLQLGLEDTMDHMLWLGEGMITKNKIKTLKTTLNEFSKIKPADIKRVAKDVLNVKRYNVSLVGPLTDQQQKAIGQIVGV